MNWRGEVACVLFIANKMLIVSGLFLFIGLAGLLVRQLEDLVEESRNVRLLLRVSQKERMVQQLSIAGPLQVVLT